MLTTRKGPGPRRGHHDEDLVVRLVKDHAETAMRVARRHSICADDAQDAYQRALVQLVRHSERLRADTAHSWLFTVVRNEALAVRDQRMKLVGFEDGGLDALERDTSASVEERIIDRDRAMRASEALGALKADEVRALSMQAAGHSYKEISSTLGWSARKVDRALTEGRARFRRRFAELESGAACEDWAPVLAQFVDGTANARVVAQLRPHLRNCPACRAAMRAHHEAGECLALVLPVALVASAAGSSRGGAFARLGDVAGRLGDAVAGGWHERAAGAMVKGQALAEAVSTGKLAAVAASAAAIAGGGIAVDEAVRQAPAPHRAAPLVARDASHVTSRAPGRATLASVASSAAPHREVRASAGPAKQGAVGPKRRPSGEFGHSQASRGGSQAGARTEFAGVPASGSDASFETGAGSSDGDFAAGSQGTAAGGLTTTATRSGDFGVDRTSGSAGGASAGGGSEFGD